MSRISCLKDYGIDEEIDPILKFNSLISVTVSTLMCLAAKCPIPKPNVKTTKLFLRTITDDKGDMPSNVKGFLNFLDQYSGPYEDDLLKEKDFKDSSTDKLMVVGTKTIKETDELFEASTFELLKEMSPTPPDSQISLKRNNKINGKKNEKDSMKKGKQNSGIKI